MSKVKTNLENLEKAESYLICVENEESVSVEFKARPIDAVGLLVPAIVGFAQQFEFMGVKDPESSIKALCHSALHALRNEEREKGNDKPEKSKDELDDILKSLDDLLKKVKEL